MPRMRTLHADLPGVNLALSLHAPSQALRAQIVPAAKAYPLHKLMEALDSYLQARCGQLSLTDLAGGRGCLRGAFLVWAAGGASSSNMCVCGM